MAKVYNLARVTTATTGTGTITLGSAVAGFLTFAGAGVSNGETVTYAIQEGSNSEIGRGVYTSSGTTLTRASVLRSTNSNNAITLAGAAQVIITPAAEDLLTTETPGGRLTLTTAVPVMTSTVSAATTVYYTPYLHRYVPLYDGTSYAMHDVGGELSQATTDSTKSPAAVTTNSNYDLFVWLDGTTYRCTRGPAWSSATARGTGAGTTELERVKGVWLNKVAITNGPAANRGTYVGTIRSNGSSQIDFNLGAAAAGGTAALIYVVNAYNQVVAQPVVVDTTATWAYGTASYRSSNNSAGNRISYIDPLGAEFIEAQFTQRVTVGATVAALTGIGVDSTTAATGTVGFFYDVFDGLQTAFYHGVPGLGQHYLQALEYASASATFNGTSVYYKLTANIRC